MTKQVRELSAKRIMVTSLSLAAAIIPMSEGLCNSTDPYHILAQYVSAIGGSDYLREVQDWYHSGQLEIAGAGLSGPIETWESGPLKMRIEVDLGVISFREGDNGEQKWEIDQNGQLRWKKDEETLKARRVREHFREFRFLDQSSDVFKVSYVGPEVVDSIGCHHIRITNSINADTIDYFIDTSTSLLITAESRSTSEHQSTRYSDYRPVGKAVVAFKESTTIHTTGMTQTATWQTIDNRPISDPALFEPERKSNEDFQFLRGKDSVRVPFEYRGGNIYMLVTINGRPGRWILDTGAGRTVIDNSYAALLGLELEGNIKGQGAGHLVDVSFVTLPTFEIADIRFESQKVVAIELKSLIARVVGLEVAGILGYDFLSRLVTRIDYANEQLTFYKAETFAYNGPGVAIKAPLDNTTFQIPLTIDDRWSGLWSLDIGAGKSSFMYPFARDNKLLDLDGMETQSHGAGGAFPEKVVDFGKAVMGGYTVEDVKISIPLQLGQGAFANAALAGNLGNDILQHFVLTLDYRNQQIFVEPGDRYNDRWPRNDSGLGLGIEDGAITAIYVSKESPASEAGFLVGDVLKSINGLDVGLFDLQLAKQLLTQLPEAGCTFEVDRAGNRATLVLRNKVGKQGEVQ